MFYVYGFRGARDFFGVIAPTRHLLNEHVGHFRSLGYSVQWRAA